MKYMWFELNCQNFEGHNTLQLISVADQGNKQLTDTLQHQYDQSLEYRLQGGQRVHRGLGFQEEDGGDGDAAGKTEGDTNNGKDAEKSEDAQEPTTADSKPGSQGSSDEKSEEKDPSTQKTSGEAPSGEEQDGGESKEADDAPAEVATGEESSDKYKQMGFVKSS